MARMGTPSRASTVDLVQEFIDSPAVAVMLGYSAQAGPNAVSLAVHDLRAGRPAIVDSSLLPSDVSGEFFDPVRLTSARLRLQRGHAPEIVDDRAQAVVDDVEPTVEEVVG